MPDYILNGHVRGLGIHELVHALWRGNENYLFVMMYDRSILTAAVFPIPVPGSTISLHIFTLSNQTQLNQLIILLVETP